MDIVAFSPDAEACKSGGDGRQAIVTEPSYLMRRAFTLRSLLKLHLDKIFSQGSPRVARIDRKIVNALLATKTF
jgi:hypothetical protein